MRLPRLLAALACLLPAACYAQTEGTVGLARDVYARKVIQDSLPPPPAVITERVVLPERVVTERVVRVPVPAPLPATVVERPILAERVVVTQPTGNWRDVLAESRFGYYDDSYFDDNWYYDYYESPQVAAPSGVARFRTGWFYAPTAERGLFSW